MQKFLAPLKNFKTRLGKWFWVILIAVVLTAGFFVFRGKNKKEVSTVKVQKGLVRQELILTGSVNAEKYARLMFPTAGKISWVGVTEGEKVLRGRALTSLDTTSLNAAYQTALNNYRNYQAGAESALDSVKDHSGDETYAQKATRTAAEVARDNAWDAIKAAKYNLDNATIRAPFDGIISALPFPSPGVNVGFTDVQVEIVDPSTIFFDVDADQSEVKDLKVGQGVTIVLDSYRDRELGGAIAFISYTPKPGEAGAVYRVKVVFNDGALGDLTPRVGMTGDAEFIISQKDNVLFAPQRFIN